MSALIAASALVFIVVNALLAVRLGRIWEIDIVNSKMRVLARQPPAADAAESRYGDEANRDAAA